MNYPPDRTLPHSRLQLMKRVLDPPKPERSFRPWIVSGMMFAVAALFLLFAR
jgi:hypothetical protein